MMKKVFALAKVLFIVGIVTLFVCPYSCRMTEEGITVLKADYQIPKIENISVFSESCTKLSFSNISKIKNLVVSPEILFSVNESFSQNPNSLFEVALNFNEPLKPGEKYVVFGTSCDETGNTLSFSVPFLGYNANVPGLKIIEVHPGYGSYTYKKNKVYLTEYVMLEVLSDGNMASVLLFSAYDGEDDGYLFPAFNVKKGEKILVHLRTREEEKSGAIDELEDDLALSTASFSKSNIRDLWSANTSARFNDKTDIIVLKDTGSGALLDAMMYATSETFDWQNEAVSSVAAAVFSSGLWKGQTPSDAICSDSLTSSKCFIKTQVYNQKDSWEISTCKQNAASMQ